MNPLLNKPTSDFNAIRDGRNSLPLYIDVDLTNARSIAANSALVLNIAGNSFFTDADTANGGNATVHFQDTALGNTSAPFFVSPGFIANVGFTQLLIENAAQAGKRIRIFYGVDIDFQAGVNASISITGSMSVISLPNPRSTYGASYKSLTPTAALTPDTVFAPGANVNGAIVTTANFLSHNSGGATFASFVAKSSAPATSIDGDVILSSDNFTLLAGNYISSGSLKTPIFIPAGKGLYYITAVAESAGYAMRSVLYTLL